MLQECLAVTVEDIKTHIVQLQEHVFVVMENIALLTVVALVVLYLY